MCVTARIRPANLAWAPPRLQSPSGLRLHRRARQRDRRASTGRSPTKHGPGRAFQRRPLHGLARYQRGRSAANALAMADDRRLVALPGLQEDLRRAPTSSSLVVTEDGRASMWTRRSAHTSTVPVSRSRFGIGVRRRAGRRDLCGPVDDGRSRVGCASTWWTRRPRPRRRVGPPP